MRWRSGIKAICPHFEEVDTHHTGQITLQQAKTHPAVVSAAMKAKPGMTGDQAVESFFSEAHQKYQGKPYDSPMTKEEWEGMTGK